MAELIIVKYSSLRDDILKHIDGMDGILKPFRYIDSVLDDSLAIEILVSSIEASELTPITAAINALDEKDLIWKEVSSRLI